MSVDAVEKVYEGSGFCIGHFWCPPDSLRWQRINTIERGPSIVVPFNGVEIEPTDARPIVTNSTRVMFYNRGQRYRRRLLDQAGDRCLFIGLEPRLVHEVLAAHPGPHRDDPLRPFVIRYGPMDPAAFLGAVELYRNLAAGRVSADAAFEQLSTLLDVLLSRALPVSSARLRVGDKAEDAVDETLRYLVLNLEQPATLAQLGARVGLSPFYLARSFRACTGMSLHECRERIRVLYALNRLESTTRLVDIAMDAGFSSHSHLTQAFRRVLNQTPSEVRRRLYRPIAR